MAIIEKSGSVSSNGTQTTSSTNTKITFKDKDGKDVVISQLCFVPSSTCTVYLNNETTVTHSLKTGESLKCNKIPIYSITIVESGVSYRYSGAY
jgi:hypothetical protein